MNLIRRFPNEGSNEGWRLSKILALLLTTLFLLPACDFFGKTAESQTLADASPDADKSGSNNGNNLITADEALPSGVEANLKVTDFALLPANDGATHPVRKLSFIRGFNVADKLGRGSYGPSQLTTLSHDVALANRDLIGLGPNDGRLSLVKARIDESAALVAFRQEARLADGSFVPVYGSQQTFVYNIHGDLTQVKNLTYGNVNGLAPARYNETEIAEFARQGVTVVPVDLDLNASPNMRPGVNDGALASYSTVVPFTAKTADVLELGVLANEPYLLPQLAYEVYLHGELGGPLTGKPSGYLAYVNAHSGEVLRIQDAHAHAYNITASAQFYDPNPIEASMPVVRNVYKVDSNYQSLYGLYTNVHNPPIGDAVEPDYAFNDYYGQGYPNDTHLLEANAYYAVSFAKQYLSKLGFSPVMAWSIYVDAIDNTTCGVSCYDSINKTIELGAGVSEAFDTDTARHEYGHALADDIDPVGWTLHPDQMPTAPMAEGTADFFSVTVVNDPEASEWVGFNMGQSFVRTLNSSYNMLYNYSTMLAYKHSVGVIWGAAFWDLRQKLGKYVADRLATQFIYHVLPTDSFHTALETAVIQADWDLYGGAHEAIIRKTFGLRAIYGSGVDPWLGTTFPRPYLDNTDITQTYNVPGASAVKLTFDAYTRTWKTTTGSQDLIYVMDANNVNIAGSPFSGTALQNQTVTVPGETAKVRLYSTPGNSRSCSGVGNVLNVVATDPANQPPVASATLSTNYGMEPLPVTMDLSGSYDPDGSIIAYSVDPGDGSWPIHLDPSYPRATHLFNRDGLTLLTQQKVFNVTVTVTDNKGDTNSRVYPVTVKPYSEGGPGGVSSHAAGNIKKCTLTQSGGGWTINCP
jgi:hypothetical protein